MAQRGLDTLADLGESWPPPMQHGIAKNRGRILDQGSITSTACDATTSFQGSCKSHFALEDAKRQQPSLPQFPSSGSNETSPASPVQKAADQLRAAMAYAETRESWRDERC